MDSIWGQLPVAPWASGVLSALLVAAMVVRFADWLPLTLMSIRANWARLWTTFSAGMPSPTLPISDRRSDSNRRVETARHKRHVAVPVERRSTFDRRRHDRRRSQVGQRALA